MKIPPDPSSRMYCRVERGEERSIMTRIQGVCGQWMGGGAGFKGGRILMAVCFECGRKNLLFTSVSMNCLFKLRFLS